MARAYDNRVKPRNFKESEMVLKKILPFKLAWQIQSPYLVAKLMSGGALIC